MQDVPNDCVTHFTSHGGARCFFVTRVTEEKEVTGKLSSCLEWKVLRLDVKIENDGLR